MNIPELLLHHQRLDQRAAVLGAEIGRVEARLGGDPEVERLGAEVAAARAEQEELARRIREREHEVEGHRARMRSRERELMSGRINNPTELMKLSAEVDHMKAAVAEEEDLELTLMEESEAVATRLRHLERQLQDAAARVEQSAPDLRSRLEAARAELASVEAERAAVWADLPPQFQAAYRRVRVPDPVSEVVGGQCQRCRVQVTSNGMQQLRRHELVNCDNCGRVLVMA